jgi:hypothetical protein
MGQPVPSRRDREAEQRKEKGKNKKQRRSEKTAVHEIQRKENEKRKKKEEKKKKKEKKEKDGELRRRGRKRWRRKAGLLRSCPNYLVWRAKEGARAEFTQLRSFHFLQAQRCAGTKPDTVRHGVRPGLVWRWGTFRK